jgi:predicted Rossmann-fold nucleotide-binding protein
MQHAFADAGIRLQESDKTAFIALPGGIGTLDEIFEV